MLLSPGTVPTPTIPDLRLLVTVHLNPVLRAPLVLLDLAAVPPLRVLAAAPLQILATALPVLASLTSTKAKAVAVVVVVPMIKRQRTRMAAKPLQPQKVR